jgi:hypothetical protein
MCFGTGAVILRLQGLRGFIMAAGAKKQMKQRRKASSRVLTSILCNASEGRSPTLRELSDHRNQHV